MLLIDDIFKHYLLDILLHDSENQINETATNSKQVSDLAQEITQQVSRFKT